MKFVAHDEQLTLWSEPKPEAQTQGPSELRYYQEEAVAAVKRELSKHRSTMVNMATGLGKTVVITKIVEQWKGRVICCAHRSELVDQLRSRLEHDTGERVGLEQAEFRSNGERIIVGSIQSLYQEGRIERIVQHGEFSLVVLDELHHYVAPSYKKTVKRLMNDGAKVFGVTATPDRGDGKALKSIIESVAYTMDILEGIEAGYLVPIDAQRVEVKEIDLRRVHSVGGDLHQGELEQVVLEGVEGVVGAVLGRWADRKGILFFPGKQSARLAHERLQALGKTSCVITDDTPKGERRHLVRQLKAGAIQYLCNCGIATEGFDWPQCALVANARPTKSRSLYGQIAGRGTRTLAYLVEAVKGPEGAAERRQLIKTSHKPDMVLLDLVGNSGKHSLCSPEDILGGRFSEAERKAAKKKGKAEGGDPVEHLKKAREELRAMARAYEAAVKYDAEGYDPFKVFGMDPKKHPELRTMRHGGEPPSLKQAELLQKWGLEPEEIRHMSRAAATKFIGTQQLRIKKGLCSYKVLKWLQKFGVDRTNISFKAGGDAMAYIKRRRWGKDWVDPDKLNRILDGESAT